MRSQTMNISIGSMHSSVLVLLPQILQQLQFKSGSSSSAARWSAQSVEGAVAEGTAAR